MEQLLFKIAGTALFLILFGGCGAVCLGPMSEDHPVIASSFGALLGVLLGVVVLTAGSQTIG